MHRKRRAPSRSDVKPHRVQVLVPLSLDAAILKAAQRSGIGDKGGWIRYVVTQELVKMGLWDLSKEME